MPRAAHEPLRPVDESQAGEAVSERHRGRAPAAPGQDPAFQRVRAQVRLDAQAQKTHPPARQKKVEAEKAAALTKDEQIKQSAEEKGTDEMERVGAAQRDAGKSFSADKFKRDLMDRINKKSPKTEDKAKEFAKAPPVEHFEESFSGDVAQEQGKVTGPLEQRATEPPTGGVVEKTAVAVPAPAFPPAPRLPTAALAAPKPKSDAEISHEGDIERLDDSMVQNRLSEEQLADSREPSFLETLKVKQEAQKKAAEAPGVYRGRESAILQAARAKAGQTLAADLGAMSSSQRGAGSQVFGGQKRTETDTERRQREIKTTIDGIYEGTVKAVKGILEAMTQQVKDDFARTLKEKTDEFNAQVTRRISDYYGDWRIDDELFGPDDVVVLDNGETRAMTLKEKFGAVEVDRINPDVYRIFVDEKGKFLRAMDAALDGIARNVETGLTAAENQIKAGKAGIAAFKATLKGDELLFATQLESEVQMKFDSLEASIDDAREDLLQTLADEYTESVAQLRKSFNEINDELKKSWLDRALDFIKTVGKTIFQLADLLLTILVRMAHLIWDIVKHPIRFFETLVAGLMRGIGDFIGNIGTYLQEAFWTWITGATAATNIRLSVGSGIESLFGLVLQVLRLTLADLRPIVEKVLGREFMQMVDKGAEFWRKAMELGEKVLEPVVILFTRGPGALWEYIKETLGGMIQAGFDRIRESVFNTFVEKGLKWIAGFFVPGGGFVKVVKAVFRAFQFVVENLDRIRRFFDAVFDSMEAAVEGRTDGVAAKIVVGLKMGVVLALDFLAKQLGIDKIVDGVQRIIQSLRRPIVSAIEWLLGKIKPFVVKLLAKMKELAAKALGGDPNAPPEQRLQNGLGEGVAAVNRLSGSRIGLAVISPVLAGIRLRNNMRRLEAEPRGTRWAVVGEVNPRGESMTAKLVDPALVPSGTFPSHVRFGALRSLTHGGVTLRVGSRMTAEPVGPDLIGQGSTVPAGPRNDLFALIGARQSRYRVGHLLNNNIGGSGDNWLNLTPLSPSGNALHFHRAEDDVRRIVDGRAGGHRWVFYDVVPRYSGWSTLPGGAHPAERQFATRLDVQWERMEPDPDRPNQLRRAGGPTNVPIDLNLPD